MYDSTIHPKTVARHVRKADFHADPSLYDDRQLENLVRRAVHIGTTGFTTVSAQKNIHHGKPIYRLTNLAEELVIRHISGNIRRVTGVKQDDRQFIITCMQKILEEGVPFQIFKFDIRSFYETVVPSLMIDKLKNDGAFSSQGVRALDSFFSALSNIGVRGLPRGISISATLAEYLMRDFDKLISNSKGVYFYARFVDDIVIITNDTVNEEIFKGIAERELPQGLQFNHKSRHLRFQPFDKNAPPVEAGSFEFLGYRFSISHPYRDITYENRIRRNVHLDIAKSKVKKIKTRVARSLLAYSQNKNFDLLLSRFRLLTSNFKYTDKKSDHPRLAGIYFNYPLVFLNESKALPALDKYALNCVTAPHPKNHLMPVLTTSQRQQILNLRFTDGFKNKRFFSFSARELSVLTKCWAYA